MNSLHNTSLIVFSSLVLLFISTDLFAQCSCKRVYKDITAIRELKLADAVFVGDVVNIKNTKRDKKGDYVQTITLKVVEFWKGDLVRTFTIVNKVDFCIQGFKQDEKWLVYAYKKENGMFVTFCCCSRTKQLSRADEDIEEFKKSGIRSRKTLAKKVPTTLTSINLLSEA